jgi:RNA polymerase sigma-70 factor (ECF subfamily)
MTGSGRKETAESDGDSSSIELESRSQARRVRLGEFFARERHNLVRFVRRLIDETAGKDGDDFVQDVMLGIFEKADITRPIADLTSYVYRSLYNRVVDAYRKKKAGSRVLSLDMPVGGKNRGRERGLALSELLEDERSDVHEALERRWSIEKLHDAVERLDPRSRAVIIATEFEGMSFRELSEEWGVPLGTLLSLKHRALKQIRNRLGLVPRDGKESTNEP